MRDAISTRRRILDVTQDLVIARGFSATTVDAVIEAAGISKGAFFHHFTSKNALGQSVLERYAAADAEILETFMTRAEAESDDPALQLITFVRMFEEASDEMFAQPGCLFVSFVYERMPDSREAHDVIRNNIELWRRRLGDKLREALKQRSQTDLDPDSLADLMFTVFEGAFILARATNDPEHVRRQLGQYRRYLQLTLDLPPDPA
ncbi:MAG TPA: TetR/AcrR family transcriptional regulator [Actinomycetota bacterium]|nr:TetR/AcrR family transcriptional regulator [Actinomycetota bacterium]